MGVRSISDRRKKLERGAGALALALLCVLGLALLQRYGALDDLNVGLMGLAGRARESGWAAPVTAVMQLASAVGGTVGRFTLLGICLLALWRGSRGRAVWLASVVIVGNLLNLALKQIFAAPRPDLLPHLDIVHTYSFPSGHAVGNMVFFGALAMLAARRHASVAAALAIALIGVSRVWLGVHWPSDVLAGWIEGLGWLALCAVWLPARRGQGEGAEQAVMRGHAVCGDEAVDPETVESARHGD
jgi:undecaprenyl-diphosphatase